MRLMPRGRLGVLWRGVLAFVVVVACAAGATATAGLLQIQNVVNIINVHKAIVSKQITLPAPGAPQTLLLIGVDHRFGQGTSPGNTDTMMLVRINDSSSTINTLSIPRDLAVNVPGYGVEKINAAYSEGGPSLLLETIRADVFPELRVNHILLVDFSSFANLINDIGCVYAQVDHRYYNQSAGPADPTTDYSSINVQPGYQKLCGGSGANLGGADTALAFVRFRHNDSDFVRQARQQDFLRWAKQNFSTSELLSKRTQLLKDFAQDVQSDSLLHSTDGLIELFDLAINADGSKQKSLPFPYTGFETINGQDDVSFSEAAAEQTYQQFMTPTVARGSGGAVANGAGAPRGGRPQGRRFKPPANMVADPGDGNSQAAHLGNAGLAVYYPKLVPSDFMYCFATTGDCNIGYEPASAYASSYPRSYTIDGTGGRRFPAYAMTLVASSGGYADTATGEYATVEGTTWRDPPILRSPSAVRIVNGKVLDEYAQGGSLAVVAWRTAHGVYWISNTLQNNITNAQMVAMAATLTRASG